MGGMSGGMPGVPVSGLGPSCPEGMPRDMPGRSSVPRSGSGGSFGKAPGTAAVGSGIEKAVLGTAASDGGSPSIPAFVKAGLWPFEAAAHGPLEALGTAGDGLLGTVGASVPAFVKAGLGPFDAAAGGAPSLDLAAEGVLRPAFTGGTSGMRAFAKAGLCPFGDVSFAKAGLGVESAEGLPPGPALVSAVASKASALKGALPGRPSGDGPSTEADLEGPLLGPVTVEGRGEASDGRAADVGRATIAEGEAIRKEQSTAQRARRQRQRTKIGGA